MLKLLRHSNFAPLWWGGLISLTGNRILSVALPFYVFNETASTLATALMIMAALLPNLLFSSVAGVVVDQGNQKRIIVATNILLALSLIPLLFVNATGWICLVYVVAFLEASVASFFRIAENALLPKLVGKDQLVQANTLNSLNDTLARLIGPALGGIFLEMGNLEMVVLVDMVSYVFVAVFTSFIRPPLSESNFSETDLKNVQGTFKRFLQDWREGLIFVLRDRRLKILLVVIGITTLGGTMMDPLFAPYFIEVLTLSASLFGFLLTVQGIGGILGGLVIGQFATHLRPFKLFGLGAVGSGILLFILFQNKSYGVALVLLFILGMVSVASRVGLQTLMQNATENNSRGRVFGLFGAVGASLELMGVALAGVMAELLGISFMLSLAALITLLAGSLVLVLLRPGRGVN